MAKFPTLPEQNLARHQDRGAESVSWVQRAAESGSVRAMWQLGELFGRASIAAQLPELFEEGIGWLRKLAGAGDLKAMQRLAELLEYIGRTDEAVFWRNRHAGYGKSAPPGDRERLARALRVIDEILHPERDEEDTSALRSRASAGDLRAMEQLGIRLDKTGHTGEAVDWLAEAAEAGKYGAARELARILRRANRSKEALTTIQRAAACWADDWVAFERVLPWLRQVGGRSSLESFLTVAAGAGNCWATAYLAAEVERNGQTAEAIRWLRPAAEKENLAAMEFLGVLLEQVGEGAEARAWYQCVDQAASSGWFFILASMLENGGWLERALIRYRNAVECKETAAMRPLTELLERMGRTEEANRLQTFGIDAGGRTAQPWQVPPSDPIAVSPRTE